MLQVAQKLHYILTLAEKFAISANQEVKPVQPISQKKWLNAVPAFGSINLKQIGFKVKPFGVLLSIDIAVSVKILLNERICQLAIRRQTA